MKIATPGSVAHRREIAVVEETADNIYSLKFILQSLGYQVSSFSYQVDFLSEFRKRPPDLIIVDMLIPNEGGFGVLEKIRMSKFGEVPVLAITAQAVKGGRQDLLNAGAQDVLKKPYTVPDLQAKLEKHLSSGSS